jgi:hypothetical protein
MHFTALHRLLGQAPGPLTDEFIDEAIAGGLAETDDLDWKAALPPAKGLTTTDFPKDIAAMANSGGGTIVYGVEESQKSATGRRDIGELNEGHERALRSAAITAISPPVFGLGIYCLGESGSRVAAVVVPASVDGPHLIYRGEFFGAPIRNDADTVWMKERQVEAMYRTRFDERRHATEAITNLYDDIAVGRDTDMRAWLIAVAHPRLPVVGRGRLSRDDARKIIDRGRNHALEYADARGIHPLESVDYLNPRPGLRRWVARNTATAETSRWRETWASVHHDGSVTIATAIGGHRTRDDHLPGERIRASAIEGAIADFMALARAAGRFLKTDEYETRIGIEWNGDSPLIIQADDLALDGTSLPIARYSPVAATVRTHADEASFAHQVHDLAEDCVNQGGIMDLQLIRPPTEV